MWPKSYAEHIREAEERLSTFDPKAVDSAWGTIEYAERGTGIPLLRAAVLGFSAGGPPAIQFALRHPERTLSLVLASAHLPTSPYVKLPAVLYRAVFSEWLFWLLKKLAPGRLARIMGCPRDSGPPPRSGNRSGTSWTVCSRSGPGGRAPCSTRSSPIPTWRAIHWRRSRFPR